MLRASALKCLVIQNPVAGKSKHELADEVLTLLMAGGAELHVEQTSAPGHAKQLAADAGEFDRVIAIGGDGTINEVINGLTAVESAPCLAIIPGGTSNVLAAEIGLPRTAAALAEVVCFGAPKAVCLGMVNGRYFSLMVGVGFDAQMIANTNLRLKKCIGGAAYAAAFFRQLVEFRSSDYRLTMDGDAKTVGSVIVCNVQRYAPRWVIAPGAKLTTPQLHVCHVASPASRASKTMPMKLFGGKWAKGRGLTIDVATSITIEGPTGEPVQADGDIVTSLPATISAVPNALHIMFPN
jgi:YegS/Rv2252/BmrU family lipid kinase